MCERFAAVMDQLGMSDANLSQQLGYANATTLSGVRRGSVFPDAERLAKLGQLVLGGCASPNLHWILTGAGEAFLPTPHLNAANVDHLEALNRLVITALVARKTRSP